MRDFTTSCYNKNLWIKEILDLKRVNGKYFSKSAIGDTLQIVNITIFGTVIEIRQLEKVILYTVDDGTGVLVGRRNVTTESEALEDWEWTSVSTNQSNSETTIKEATLCDSVFNDYTIQQEDVDAHKKSISQALDSLRWSIVNSFRSSESIVVGDTVCIDGKIYSYFGANQIYINAIRPVAIEEELILMTTKLENTHKFNNLVLQFRSHEKNTSYVSQKQFLKRNPTENVSLERVNCIASTSSEGVKIKYPKRPSGMMTFDTFEESRVPLNRDILGVRGKHEHLPSPLTKPGALLIPPTVFETTTTFDTMVRGDDEATQSSSDEDIFIFPTPKKKK